MSASDTEHSETKQGAVSTAVQQRLEVRALISNKECGMIIGKGGSKIAHIRKESMTYISILKSEYPAAPERVIRINGSVFGCTNALQHITTLIFQGSQAEREAKGLSSEAFTFKLLIHRAVTGALIGKGGETIRGIMERSGCKIHVSNECLEGSTDKSVDLAGTLNAVQLAIQEILPKLEGADPKPGTTVIPYVPGKAAAEAHHLHGVSEGYGVPYGGHGQFASPSYRNGRTGFSSSPAQRGAGASSPHAGGVESFYMIPTSGAGALIGKGGSIINNIKAQSGTQIIISDPESTNPAERKVKITGPTQGVEMAVSLIKQMFPSDAAAEQAGVPKETASYMIPTSSAGSLIGKGGSIIGHIKAQSGTQITISEPDPSNPKEREVKITGSRHGVQVAVYNIKQRMEHAPAGRPSGEVSEQMCIRSSAAGSIIGKGGSVVKEINALSGCQIRLSEGDRENPQAERIVTITGLPQHIPTAVNMIRQRIDAGPGLGPASPHRSFAPSTNTPRR